MMMSKSELTRHIGNKNGRQRHPKLLVIVKNQIIEIKVKFLLT